MIDDDRAFAEYGDSLVAAVEHALPGWIERAVRTVLADEGRERAAIDPVLLDVVTRRAVADIVGQLGTLLARDVDDQPTNPLAILRRASRYPAEVLRSMQAAPRARDDFAQRVFPDDIYALTPAAFGDFGPEVHEAGMAWGAAKAYVHLRRRAARG